MFAVTYEDQADKNEVEVRGRCRPRLLPVAARARRAARMTRTCCLPRPAQVVFVSADNDQEGFEEYYAEMPWAAIPFDAAQREAVPDKFDVQGIPRVVVLNAADGTVVNADARAVITAKKSLSGVF